mmetsp:Transcript_41933/g.89316  ORF Transcript_41933/g.89316 Transcript_41933/m.89316 type:complete len:168 (+) Transcript_41933:1994-2497(+)
MVTKRMGLWKGCLVHGMMLSNQRVDALMWREGMESRYGEEGEVVVMMAIIMMLLVKPNLWLWRMLLPTTMMLLLLAAPSQLPTSPSPQSQVLQTAVTRQAHRHLCFRSQWIFLRDRDKEFCPYMLTFVLNTTTHQNDPKASFLQSLESKEWGLHCGSVGSFLTIALL